MSDTIQLICSLARIDQHEFYQAAGVVNANDQSIWGRTDTMRAILQDGRSSKSERRVGTGLYRYDTDNSIRRQE
jgi:hypothetical protein